jgi:hypothetical protein
MRWGECVLISTASSGTELMYMVGEWSFYVNDHVDVLSSRRY